MELFREHMASVRGELQDHDLNEAANREELTHRVAEARSRLSMGEIRACRRQGELGRQARREIAKAVGNGIFLAQLRDMGSRRRFETIFGSPDAWCCGERTCWRTMPSTGWAWAS